MPKNRSEILTLHRLGKPNCVIARMLGIARQSVSRTIKRFIELGHGGDRPRQGKPASVNTSKNRKIIKQRLMRNPKTSLRKIARETGISDRSVRRMVKNDLAFKPYKLQKVQLLTDENKLVRLQRSRRLIRRHATQGWEKILFTDEKLFTLEQSHNRQNDRIWSSKSPGNAAIVENRQNPLSVMVWAGICASGKTPLVFVDQGVKINQEVYRRDILEAVVLPWAQRHFGEEEWTFQQDSAPAHKAKRTQDWCKANFPNFISSNEWPPYSPDLNPMDYSVWSILESRACAKRHKSLKSLKSALLREWDRLKPKDLRAIVENFPKRLKLCVEAEGGHFEKA